MAITLSTAGTTGKIYRTSPVNANAAYTVLFRVYVPSAITSTFLWGISGATGSSGNIVVGTYGDFIRGHSSGVWEMRVNVSGTETGSTSAVTPTTSAWHSMAIVRTSTTNVYYRLWTIGNPTGTNQTPITVDVSAREAQTVEGFFRGNSGINFVTNARITNYKCWNVALSDAEVDAEMLAITVAQPTGLFSVSEMMDESVLANNLAETGSSVAWTAAAAIAAGANDPGVDYGGDPDVTVGASGSASTPGIGTQAPVFSIPL